MATRIDVAGQNATDAMAGKIGDAIDAMELRLKAMNDQMATIVDQMSTSTANSHRQNE